MLMDVELQALNTSLHDLTNVVLTEDGYIHLGRHTGSGQL